MVMITKRCKGCDHDLPLSMFHKNPPTKDGLNAKCKRCRSAEFAAYRAKNRQRLILKHREYDSANSERNKLLARVYRLKNKEFCKSKSKIWFAQDSRRQKAAIAVRRCVLNGSLIRPDQCSKCQKPCKVEFHHGGRPEQPDPYHESNWLVGVWLCHSCHRRWHRENPDAVKPPSK